MNNVDIYKLATEYMAMRENYSVSGDEAAKAKAAGVEKFADLFLTDFSKDPQDKSLRWIQEYEEHLRYLIDNDGGADEIEGTTNIIQQLRLQKVERAMYEALGFNDDYDDRKPKSIFETLNKLDASHNKNSMPTADGLGNLLLAQLT